jgi:hypothetical protein
MLLLRLLGAWLGLFWVKREPWLVHLVLVVGVWVVGVVECHQLLFRLMDVKLLGLLVESMQLILSVVVLHSNLVNVEQCVKPDSKKGLDNGCFT